MNQRAVLVSKLSQLPLEPMLKAAAMLTLVTLPESKIAEITSRFDEAERALATRDYAKLISMFQSEVAKLDSREQELLAAMLYRLGADEAVNALHVAEQ